MHNSRNLSLMFAIFFFLPQNLSSEVIPSGCCLTIVGPTTITQPGNYRISQDIDGDIIIDADNVVICGENRTINGRISSTGHSCMRVQQTILRNSPTEGLLFDNCSNISICEIELTSNVTGLAISNSNDVIVEKFSAKDNTASGVWVQTSNRVALRNINLKNNGLDGASIQDSSEIEVYLANADANTRHGLSWVTTTRAKTQASTFTNNGSAGVFLDNTNSKSLNENFFSNNNVGIRITNNSNQVMVARNWALANELMGVEAIQSATLSFLDNDIMGSPTGCHLNECDDSFMQNNNVSTSECEGVVLESSRRDIIVNNRFYRNNVFGLQVVNTSTQIMINENEAYFNGTGIDAGNNIAINNIASNNENAQYLNVSGGPEIEASVDFTNMNVGAGFNLM